MDLKGAEIRTFYLLTDGMPGQNKESTFIPLPIKYRTINGLINGILPTSTS
jgi:hypothetical protein